MSELRHLSIERRGELVVVRIERPPANAMDLELLEEGALALDRLHDQRPAGTVIAGTGGFFSAGVDLKFAPTLDREGQRRMVAGINRLFAGWHGFPGPVVCAVTGHAIAGGLILALCGDYRVGSTEGKLGLTELRAGVPYPAVAMAVVKAELGPASARRLVLGAELVDPQEALTLGALDELAPPDQVLERALEVAGELAALPGAAYATVKRQLRPPLSPLVEEDPLLDGWLGGEAAGAASAILDR